MGKSFCIFALALLSCPLFGFWDLPEPKKMGLPSCMEMPELKLIPSPRYWERNRKWQGVPSIERTSGGRLWSAWYAGSVWEGFSDRGNYIVVYTSGDDGKTWELVAVYDATVSGDANSWDPRLWKAPDGALYLTVTRSMKSKEGKWVTSWKFKALDPENPRTEWSEPVFNGCGVSLNKPTVLSDGSIIQPLVDNHGLDKPSLFWTISRDGGKTFEYYSCAEGDYNRKDLGEIACEHMAVQRSDGSLLMFIRMWDCIGSMESFDNGKTWKNFKPFTKDFGIRTRFNLTRLKSGNILLVANDSPNRQRDRMTAYLSEDEGKTFPYKLLLDGRKNLTYPDVALSDDGFIYIIYDNGRYLLDAQEILFAKITEADIKAGKLVNQSSSLQNSISKLAPYGGGVKFDNEPFKEEKIYKELLKKYGPVKKR